MQHACAGKVCGASGAKARRAGKKRPSPLSRPTEESPEHLLVTLTVNWTSYVQVVHLAVTALMHSRRKRKKKVKNDFKRAEAGAAFFFFCLFPCQKQQIPHRLLWAVGNLGTLGLRTGLQGENTCSPSQNVSTFLWVDLQASFYGTFTERPTEEKPLNGSRRAPDATWPPFATPRSGRWNKVYASPGKEGRHR